jgi:hypothetical protein
MMLNLPEAAITSGANPTANQDIIVILGSDYQGPPSVSVSP